MSEDSDRMEAIQNVVDRVGSYQDGAPAGTVEKELRSGAQEVGVDVSDDEVSRLVVAIESNDGDVSAAEVLHV